MYRSGSDIYLTDLGGTLPPKKNMPDITIFTI